MPQFTIYIDEQQFNSLKTLARILYGIDENHPKFLQTIRDMIRDAINDYIRKYENLLREIYQKFQKEGKKL